MSELDPAARDLLADVAQVSITHLAELASDLTHTSELLGAAIAHLLAEFNGLSQALQAQQSLLHEAAPELAARMATLSADVQQRVQGMVTGLQFEDMTKQLIGHSQDRVAGMSAMLAELGRNSLHLGCEQLQAQLKHSSSALFEALQKSVIQQRMDGGDVELF